MDEKQIPIRHETTTDRHLPPSHEVHEDPERAREEVFQKSDEDDEMPFDVPRD